jgi:diadenosine tetraphosphate (Ap4A) HIT family hydrolase
MENVILDGESLTFEQVLAVAHGKPGQPRVVIGQNAIPKIERAAQAVQTLLDGNQVVYGITTGFGAFKNKVISRDQVEELQRNILISHACGVGNPFDVATTRAIMLIRANTLARGHSGIRIGTLQCLVDMLNAGVHPIIPEKGSLGASGDLAPLAHMALPIIGEGEAEFRGQRMSGAEAMRQAGLSPIALIAKEGLALTNGTGVMCAVGVLETARAERISHMADVAGCLSLEALNGTTLAYDERIHALRPFPRQRECAAFLRQTLAGSEFTRAKNTGDVQDAYTLRCIPQVHGAARDAIAYARWAFEIELNAQRNYQRETGRALFDDIIAAEQKDGRRILFEDEHAIGFVPYFARYAYEVYLAPKRRVPYLHLLTDAETHSLARGLKDITARYDRLWDMSFPYVMPLHQAPVNSGDVRDFHAFIGFLPPLRQPGLLKYLAGPEIGGGNFLSDTSPEAKAQELRSAITNYELRIT